MTFFRRLAAAIVLLATFVSLQGCATTTSAPSSNTTTQTAVITPAVLGGQRGQHTGNTVQATHGHQGDSHGGMTHRFTSPVQWANVFDDPARDAWQKPDEVVALMGITSTMTVADLGAGTGYFIGRLDRAAATGRVLAVDVEPSMVEYLEARGQRDGWRNVAAHIATATDPTLPAAGVDRILIVDVWHHLSDRAAYAAKIAQALKPGGAVFVVDFEMDSPMGPGKNHRILPRRLAADLQSAGLVTSMAIESLPNQYIIVGRKL